MTTTLARSVTDWDVDRAAEIIEQYVREGIEIGCLRDFTVRAADEVRKLWRIGYVCPDDPSHDEPPAA